MSSSSYSSSSSSSTPPIDGENRQILDRFISTLFDHLSRFSHLKSIGFARALVNVDAQHLRRDITADLTEVRLSTDAAGGRRGATFVYKGETITADVLGNGDFDTNLPGEWKSTSNRQVDWIYNINTSRFSSLSPKQRLASLYLYALDKGAFDGQSALYTTQVPPNRSMLAHVVAHPGVNVVVLSYLTAADVLEMNSVSVTIRSVLASRDTRMGLKRVALHCNVDAVYYDYRLEYIPAKTATGQYSIAKSMKRKALQDEMAQAREMRRVADRKMRVANRLFKKHHSCERCGEIHNDSEVDATGACAPRDESEEDSDEWDDPDYGSGEDTEDEDEDGGD
jgi:hypothetical protein